MLITVNGESRNIPEESTAADLLRELDLKAAQVVVEVNLDILKREALNERTLQEGDQIEILHFVGGG